MKKILLTTVMAVMLTAGAMAQNTARQALGRLDAAAINRTTPVSTEQLKKLPSTKAGAMKAPAKAAPQGTEKEYYLDYLDYLYKIGSAPRYHMSANIIFGENNKVYLKNMIFTYIIEDAWIEGTLSADGSEISITNGQLLADIQGQKLYLCKMLVDNTTSNISPDKDNEVKLVYDKTTGMITMKDENSILGVFDEDYTGFYTYIQSMSYIPAEMFPAATEHDYSCTYDTQDGPTNYNGKAKMLTIESICYINGLMPDFPDAWVIGQITDNGIVIPSYQTVDDDMGMAFIETEEGYISEEYTLTFDQASDSYKSQAGYALVDLFATQNGMGYSTMHTDISLKKTGTAGIGNAVTGDEGKEVVKSELFDLSGRRVGDTQKGVVIKVTKYADGSSNATKVIK